MKVEFLPGNRIDLLETGAAYFPALAEAIGGATREVYLETYIFEDDTTGRAIADALACAAGRGVTVRVLVDGFGAKEFPQKLLPGLLAQGVEVLVYRRELSTFKLRRHRLRRLHRKVVVIDVRPAGAYRDNHIAGALSVPLDTVGQRAAELKASGKPVVAYCT